MKYFCAKPTGYTPMLSEPRKGAVKIKDLNPNTIVTPTLLSNDSQDEVIVDNYLNAFAGTSNGWIERNLLDPCPQNLPHDIVDMGGLETPSKTDFFQYANYKSSRQVNLCGWLAVAASIGLPLKQILEIAEQKDVTFFDRIFRMKTSRVATGTSDGDLIRIYAKLGHEAKTLSQYKYYTPDLLKRLKGAIVSIHVDNAGRISGNGILHWVMIWDVVCEKTDAIIYFYNSLQVGDEDGIDFATFKQFVASAQSPYGVIRETN